MNLTLRRRRTLALVAATAFAPAIACAQAAAGRPSRSPSSCRSPPAAASIRRRAWSCRKLGERLKQTFVIENVAGAAGTIGTRRRRARAGRRLHAAVRGGEPDQRRAAGVSRRSSSTTRFKDLRAGRAGRHLAVRADRQPEAAAAGTAELLKLAKAAARQAQLRHRRRRHLDARHGRADQAARRHRHRARALQVGPAGADRAGVGAARPGGDADHAGPAVHQGRQGQGASASPRSSAGRRCPTCRALAETPALKELEVDSWYGLFAPAGTDRGDRRAPVAARSPRCSRTRICASRMADAGLKAALSPSAAPSPRYPGEGARRTCSAVVKAAGIKTE